MKIIPDMIVPDTLLVWKEFELVCGWSIEVSAIARDKISKTL